MICHLCGKPAIGQCKSCAKFYCSAHGDLYCDRCKEQATAIRSGEPEPTHPTSFGAGCYKCDETPDRTCTLCGRFFCLKHGGDRWVWTSAAGTRGGGNHLSKRVICDECSPTPGFMAFRIAFMIAIFVLAFGFAVFVLIRML